jgi:hypothetical protein
MLKMAVKARFHGSFLYLAGTRGLPFYIDNQPGANSVNDQQQRERIWISPQKFWAVTKNMSSEETEKLMDTVTRLAQEDRIDLLKKFEFISVGDPYHRQAC